LPHPVVTAITMVQDTLMLHIFQVVRFFAIAFVTVAVSACARQTGPQPDLRVEDLVVGSGAVAERGACVYVHYSGWLADGKQFDSSRDSTGSGAPVGFVLGTGQVIAGWDRGFAGMRVGGKRKLFVPYRLGYGSRGAPPTIPASADLVFEVELVGVRSQTTNCGRR
jgi:FKBP-type peptidyl-prolyl cis-trans isomerase